MTRKSAEEPAAEEPAAEEPAAEEPAAGGSVVGGSVAERLARVRERIARSARAAGRQPESVRLLAVSKRQAPELIRAAYAAGQRDFGENYVQELLEKAEALSGLGDLRWHFIGHLQRNKVRKLMGLVSAVHAVDSPGLAAELGRRAAACGVPPERRWKPGGRLPVFVEVNLSGQAQRAGCAPAELGELIEAVRAWPALELVGLMGVAPGLGDPEQSRPSFEQLVELRDVHGGVSLLPELSLGMSRDLEVAVSCGSSWVRVGTDVFGARKT